MLEKKLRLGLPVKLRSADHHHYIFSPRLLKKIHFVGVEQIWSSSGRRPIFPPDEVTKVYELLHLERLSNDRITSTGGNRYCSHILYASPMCGTRHPLLSSIVWFSNRAKFGLHLRRLPEDYRLAPSEQSTCIDQFHLLRVPSISRSFSR